VRIKNASLEGTNILVLVTKREEEVDTNFFSGFFSPDVSLVYNGIDYLQEIKIEAEDFTSYLDVNVGQYVPAYENFQIMNATASGISIVHHLFTLAGLSHDLIDPTVVLSGTIEAFTCSEGATALSLLDTLLFEHEYTANWNEQGLFSPIRWIPVSGAIPVFEFNDTNILAEVSEGGGYVGVDGVSVDWFDVATISGVRLYTADLPYADDGSFAGYYIWEDYYWPVETNARWWEPKGTEPRTVYQEYSVDGVKAKTSPYWEKMMRIKASLDAGHIVIVIKKGGGGSMNYGDVSALVTDLMATADFSDVMITKNHAVYDDYEEGIVRDITNFYNKKAQIRYFHPDDGVTGPTSRASLFYMHIDGDAVYKSAVNTYTAGDVSDSKKVVEYPSIFIFNEREAITIAQALLADAKLGGRAWTFQSEYRVAEGSYVNIDLLNGTIGSGIVLERTYDDLTQIFSYIVKATSYYVFVNESRDASIYPASPNYQMVRIEAQGASAVGAAREASIILDLSTYAIERSRVGLLTPPTIEMDSIYGYNNTDYAGRYRVEVAVSGTDYILGYESATDESHYEYTVPVTVSGLYVQRVRVGLYRSGSFDTLLKSAMVSVTAEASPAPLYWGGLFSPPAEDYNTNDSYFDKNVPISGGGYLRYWTGSLWDQATGIWPYWSQVNSLAMNDMTAWSVLYGTDIAAVNAMIVNLTSQYAFIQNLYAQDSVVTGSFRLYNGQGVQKRCIEMKKDNFDFIDVPDTSPASPEVLRGRIGRIGVGETILIDGTFKAPLSAEWSAESVINNAITAEPSIIQQADGEKRVLYRVDSTSYLAERHTTDGTWGAESIITAAASYHPALLQQHNGEYRAVYRHPSPAALVQKITSGGVWGDESTISDIGVYPAIVQQPDGEYRIIYLNVDGYLVQKITSSGVWGDDDTELVISTDDCRDMCMILQQDGEYRMAYWKNADKDLYERITENGIWGGESLITSGTIEVPSLVQEVSGEFRVAYWNGSIKEKVTIDGVWGTETSIASGSWSSYTQLANGDLAIAYKRAADGYLVERTLQCYARIGAGVTDEGVSTDGRSWWEITGNGRLRQWGWTFRAGNSTSSATVVVTYPRAFKTGTLPQFLTSAVLGYKNGSDPTTIADTTALATIREIRRVIDNATCSVGSYDPANHTSNTRVVIAWEAIGEA
jgi:hypothetical protein